MRYGRRDIESELEEGEPSASARELQGRRRQKNANLAILSAAAECFREAGYEGTSLSEVAKRAGLSRQGLYGHFRNKDALFTRLLIQHSIDSMDRVTRGLDFRKDPTAVLTRTFLMMSRYMRASWGRVLFDPRNRTHGARVSRRENMAELTNRRLWFPIIEALSEVWPQRVTMEKASLCLNYLLVGFLAYPDDKPDYSIPGEAAARYIFGNSCLCPHDSKRLLAEQSSL
jgi:AcrR family transcriptional regulator